MIRDMAFISSEILSLRLPNMPETLFFSNNLVKRNHKERDRASGVAKKCRCEGRYFWKSVYGECTTVMATLAGPITILDS
jgi:hypothetical protein